MDTALARWMMLAWIDGVDAPDPRLVDIHAQTAYEFAARREAWLRLCREYGVDGDELLVLYDAYDRVKWLEERLPPLAPSREEADALWRKHHPDGRTVRAEDFYEDMKTKLEADADRWRPSPDQPLGGPDRL